MRGDVERRRRRVLRGANSRLHAVPFARRQIPVLRKTRTRLIHVVLRYLRETFGRPAVCVYPLVLPRAIGADPVWGSGPPQKFGCRVFYGSDPTKISLK